MSDGKTDRSYVYLRLLRNAQHSYWVVFFLLFSRADDHHFMDDVNEVKNFTKATIIIIPTYT